MNGRKRSLHCEKVSAVEENDRNTYTTNYIPLNVIAVKNPLNNMAAMCP